MAERMRIFVGSTELSYQEAYIVKSDDFTVDQAKVRFAREDAVTPASVLQYRQADGSTVAFRATVRDIKRPDLWEAECYSNGYELMNVRVQNVYTNKTPEYIVQDIVDNYTQTLTYASTGVSGITITDQYIADGYAIDIIRDMMSVTGWQVRIDSNDNVYFEKKGYTDNGRTFSDSGIGTKVNFVSWDEITANIVNHVELTGGFEGRGKIDERTGTGLTSWSLTYKPSGALRVTVGGVEQSPTVILGVDADARTVTTTPLTDPVFYYNYNRPVLVDDQDDDSINLYHETFKALDAPMITTEADGRKFTQGYLQSEAYPKTVATAVIPGFDWSLEVNEKIRCINSIRGRDEFLYIKQIEYNGGGGYTTVKLGEKTYDGFDMLRNIEDEIKKLKRKVKNDGERIFSRTVRRRYRVELSSSVTWEYNSPENSLIPGTGSTRPPTLCFPRASLAEEPDCTNNGNTGTWSGTGVTSGSQYLSSASGKRLYCADFDGVSRYFVTASDVFASDPPKASICFWVYFDSFASFQRLMLIGINGINIAFSTSNYLRFEYYLDGVVRQLDVTNFTSTYSTGTWYLVTLVLDNTVGAKVFIDTATASASPVASDSFTGTDYDKGIGVSRFGASLGPGNYFNGRMDELMIFTIALTQAQRQLILDKNITGLIPNMAVWYAFDDPRPGDRSTSRVTVP